MNYEIVELTDYSDVPESHLRLYCMRFGMVVIILFGGGFKSKEAKAWQDDPKLSEEANLAIKLAKDINDRFANGSIGWSENKKEIIIEFED